MATNPYSWMAPPRMYAPQNTGGMGGGFAGGGALNASQQAQWDQQAAQMSANAPRRTMNPNMQNRGMPSAGANMNMPNSGVTPMPSGSAPPTGSNIGTITNPRGVGSGGAQGILDQWGKAGMADQSKYMDENYRNMAEGYSNYYAIPAFNAALAQQTQNANELQFGVTSAEQARLNTHGMGIADRGANREDLALDYSQKNNARDYAYSVKEGDRRYGLDAELGRGAQQTNQYNADTTRMIGQEQARIAQYEAATGRMDVEGRQRLEQFSNDTARMGVQGGLANDAYANQTARTGMQNDYNLGLGANANDRYGIDVQRELGVGQNTNQAYSNSTERQAALANAAYQQGQLGLGQGQLTLSNRELDTNTELSRERMRNDLTMSRYQNMGRANDVNARAVRAWY